MKIEQIWTSKHIKSFLEIIPNLVHDEKSFSQKWVWSLTEKAEGVIKP